MDKKLMGSPHCLNSENLYSKTLSVRLTNSKSEEKLVYFFLFLIFRRLLIMISISADTRI